MKLISSIQLSYIPCALKRTDMVYMCVCAVIIKYRNYI